MERDKKTLEAFSKIMWGVAEEFGGKISENGMQTKFEALKEFSIQEIQDAGMWILQNRDEKFPPVPTVKEFIDAMVYVDIRRVYQIEEQKLIGKTNGQNN